MIDIQPTSPRRVKVYSLQDDRWIDRGTGYCSGEIESETEKPVFIVRNEQDDTEVLLKAPIEGTTQYQKQQDTLIVWTDPEGNDFALSFQELEGCYSICDFLIAVQQSIEPNISLVAVVPVGADGEITEMIAGPVPPPPEPQDENLPEILDYFNQGSKTTFFRESISKFIVQENYLPKLVDVFHRNEQNKNLTNLHYLCDIIKTLVFYNDTNILEHFLDDEIIIGVVGILEYDPDFPNYKSNNREYLSDETKFKEVVPLQDEDTRDIIKRTFRLQFLKDVVLARLLDDATFGWIATLIYFNQVKIIKFLKESEVFLKNLFALYEGDDFTAKKPEAVEKVMTPKSDGSEEETKPAITEEMLQKKRDGIKLIHQFVIVSRGLQASARSQFYSALVKRGLFKLIGFAFKDTQTSSRVFATELIVSIVEHDVLLINGTSVPNDDLMGGGLSDDDFGADENPLDIKEKFLSDDMTLFSLLTFILLTESDIGLKTQVSEALKVLLHPSPSLATTGSSTSSLNTTDYLTAFYQEVSHDLFEPLIKLHSGRALTPDSGSNDEKIQRHDSVLYQKLCELVSLCATEHAKPLSRSFILENNVLLGVSRLVGPQFPLQTRLAGLRCLKSIIALDDQFYTRYIIMNDVLKPVMDLLHETNNCNNLANSSCLDMLNTLNHGESHANNRLLRGYLCSSYRDVLSANELLGKELLQRNDAYNEKGEQEAAQEDDEEEVVNAMTSPDPEYAFEDSKTPEKRQRDESESESESEADIVSITSTTSVKREKSEKKKDKRKKTTSILKSKFVNAGAKLLNMKKE